MPLTHREIEAAYREGRRLLSPFSKTPSQTTGSGIWYDLSMSSGNPIAQYYSGVTLTSTALKRSTDVGLNHGQPVGDAYQKYLHKINVQVVSATAAPLTLEMLDYLMFYPGISMDAGVQTMTTNIALPRYPTGAGVQMMMVELFPYAGACQCQVTYTNSDGVAGRLSPVLTLNSQVVFGTIATSASATAGASGRYIPLQSGDSGVRSIDSVEILGAGDVGVLAIVLVKPMITFNIMENTQATQFDLWDNFRDLPVIEDDAYLNMICMPVGTLAGANITGEITTFWSPI